jgi:hypothetical protein
MLHDKNKAVLSMVISLLISLARAHDQDADHHYHIDGYTFVFDDLIWLIIIILAVSSLMWLCCCMDPMFEAPPPPCYRPCQPLPACDPVIHVKIDNYSRRCKPVICRQGRNDSNPPLAQSRPEEDGIPSAPPQNP